MNLAKKCIIIILGLYVICLVLGLLWPTMAPLNKSVYCNTTNKLWLGCPLLGLNILAISVYFAIIIIGAIVLILDIALHAYTIY